ncbi:unnamed protein product [Rotaria socialis]|uniref:Ferric-chelate reductase 1 n=1 Tax=Rotaria socialis TaxID=392032 RepID=A0A820T8Z2_9BILA|nr:unnamed protein product [Rotaria socialis]
MTRCQMIKFIFILISIKLAYGYPDGAPNSICTVMLSHHDVSPKICQPKYIIQSDTSEYDINQILRSNIIHLNKCGNFGFHPKAMCTAKITVRGSTDADYFKGILLVAKDQNNQHIIGTWSLSNSSIKTISCNETDNTTITHLSTENKLQIAALWHAPSFIPEGNIFIKATVVTSYDEIYVDCFNITLKPKQKNSLRVQSIPTNIETRMIANPKTKISWDYSDNIVTVIMTSEPVNVGEWTAIGFSLDQDMGNEYIFVCQVSSTGNALLRRMHTKLGKRPPLPSSVPVNINSAVSENGGVTCKFSFETNSTQADNESAPIIIGENYHLIYAAGRLRAGEQVAKHNFTFVSTKTYQLQNSEAIDLDESLTTTTAAPHANNIRVNITWSYADSITTVKMVIDNLKISQWLAMGLSLDESMGHDHVFICQRLNDNTILLGRFINPEGRTRPALASTIVNPGGSFNISLQKFENGITYCDFTLSNFAGTQRRKRQNSFPALSQTASYRPLIAIGNLDSSNNLMQHAQNSREALSQTVLLNRNEIIIYDLQSVGSDSTGLMKAHGIIMLFTWIVLVSTGILVARYFKQSWPNSKICGKAVWFGIHRTIMTCVATLTLVAFILILVYKKGQWISQKNQREFAHSIVGILVISFSVIQPFMALFRCNPDDRYRFIFNYVHATVGFSALVLSIVAIFLAMFFTQFQFQLNKEWSILVVWSCWLPIVFIIFETIEIYFRKKNPSLTNKVDAYDMNDLHANSKNEPNANQSKENPTKDRIKLLALLLHIILAFGLALALMILIGRS